MTPEEFTAKWSKIQQKETAVSQSHFNDICRLVGHPVPDEHDPEGTIFSFETGTMKPDGRKGFADVFFRGHFIWEYKSVHKNLNKAYRQLQLYRENLQNPPLLITSDTHKIIIHTNFNNYPVRTHEINFADIISGDGVEKLRWAFYEPDRFKPEQNQQQITEATADTFLSVADRMKNHRDKLGEGTYSNEQLAHFLARLLFALFASDMGLLPARVFADITENAMQLNLQPVLRELFLKMRAGGFFGVWPIRHFNGNLFDDAFVPPLPDDLSKVLLTAVKQDWSAIDPSIFGTLFERVIDESKRAQLGAHYTHIDDIMLIIDPILMAPLRAKWGIIRRESGRLMRDGNVDAAHALLADFADEIGTIRVLDPACGSGNFLYVALRKLLDLQKRIIAWASRHNLPVIPFTVSPQQLYGLELNVYAHELAKITVWIGYLQWRKANGFEEMGDPVLRPLNNIKRMDSILIQGDDGRSITPEWPATDVIIGNPPFLGSQRMRSELSNDYLERLYKIYDGIIPGQSDLVCYWFEKARDAVEQGTAKRVGLIATSSIRGGANRTVLKRIKASGNIFMAWSDNPWVLEGAAVRISLVGFDDGSETTKTLDGKKTAVINSDLTDIVNLTAAKQLSENGGVAFQGPIKVGNFAITADVAARMLSQTNKSMLPNSDVVKPWMNGSDITRRPRGMYIIDFGECSMEEAAKYEVPFRYVEEHVKAAREKNRDHQRKTHWWRLGQSGAEIKGATAVLSRFIITARVAKHRLFIWVEHTLLPDSATVGIAREDDYFFGVLQSRLHENWALRLGTSLGVTRHYTPTTTFKTFPFPWILGQEPSEADDERVAEIAYWARALVEWRQAWLNPPRNGMNGGNGGVDTVYEHILKKRTLTNLYNGLAYYRQTANNEPLFNQMEFETVTKTAVTRPEIEELDDIHVGLDRAVLDAYGWPRTLTDEEILERLLALNVERAAA